MARIPAEVDIDQAWKGIQFLLTGFVWKKGSSPQGIAMLGGKQLGLSIEDVSLAYLMSIQVQEISDALLDISPDMFAKRLDIAKMNNVNRKKIDPCSMKDFFRNCKTIRPPAGGRIVFFAINLKSCYFLNILPIHRSAR